MTVVLHSILQEVLPDRLGVANSVNKRCVALTATGSATSGHSASDRGAARATGDRDETPYFSMIG